MDAAPSLLFFALNAFFTCSSAMPGAARSAEQRAGSTRGAAQEAARAAPTEGTRSGARLAGGAFFYGYGERATIWHGLTDGLD